MQYLTAIKIAVAIALCSVLIGAGFYAGTTYQKGVVAEERLDELKKYTTVLQERDNYQRDLEGLTAKVKKVEEEAQEKAANAKVEVTKAQEELKTTKTALSVKLAEINRLAVARDAGLNATPAKAGSPRCRGPILSPGLLQDINAAIEVSAL